MAWECIIAGKELDDVKADRKSAKAVEKYKISGRAIYFEGKYLPIDCIGDASIHDSVYNPRCCCGRGIPVKKIRIECGMEKPLILMVEKDENARRIADMIKEAQDSRKESR